MKRCRLAGEQPPNGHSIAILQCLLQTATIVQHTKQTVCQDRQKGSVYSYQWGRWFNCFLFVAGQQLHWRQQLRLVLLYLNVLKKGKRMQNTLKFQTCACSELKFPLELVTTNKVISRGLLCRPKITNNISYLWYCSYFLFEMILQIINSVGCFCHLFVVTCQDECHLSDVLVSILRAFINSYPDGWKNHTTIKKKHKVCPTENLIGQSSVKPGFTIGTDTRQTTVLCFFLLSLKLLFKTNSCSPEPRTKRFALCGIVLMHVLDSKER